MNPDRLESLFARTKSGIKPGLEVMRSLNEVLDHPERSFLCVHVAGTNGKGSVCAMVASVLQEIGLRVGLFTSPHLIRVNERIRIQGNPVTDEVLERALDAVEAVEEDLARLPTFFETLTALAFLSFREAGVQIAVLETGLGGRLDSTNVVEPLVSGITRIDMDHQAFLGDTLEKIAGEKAGIIKPGRPVVIGAQQDAAHAVITARAREMEAGIRDAVEQVDLSGRRIDLHGQRFDLSTPEMDYGRIRIPLLGSCQVENLATAVSLVEAVCAELQLEVDPERVKAGLAATHWPARGQVLSEHPPILLDVAHNPGGARALRQALREVMGKKAKGVWVWTSLADKDPATFLSILKPMMSQVLCVELHSPRALPGDQLRQLAEDQGIPARVCSLNEAKALLPELAAEADFGCVAGSVYLAGEWLSDGPQDPGERIR
jgi:dihydrofolate synthase/folylpolyglutamate synthase